MGTVPFPLFHGTSSHYLELFRPGTVPGDWPYGDAAISLLGETWAALREFGREPDWWVERTLNQVSGPANWQHGELYLTPSRLSAARYAVGRAIDGGELLTMCPRRCFFWMTNPCGNCLGSKPIFDWLQVVALLCGCFIWRQRSPATR